jgi:hypothetical protein
MGQEALVSLSDSDNDPSAALGELFRSSWDDLVMTAWAADSRESFRLSVWECPRITAFGSS